jgi:crossover junction endodeoxyribonuclease RuvC
LKILGIDTSLRSTGFAVLAKEGSQFSVIESGTIKNKPKAKLTSCVRNIFEKVSELLRTHSPDAVAVESVIYAKNALTTLALGQARGAVLTAAALSGIEVYEYEPRRMKRSVCGNATAEKLQIQQMVKTLFHLPEIPQNDEADAMGLAFCHINSNSLLKREESI